MAKKFFQTKEFKELSKIWEEKLNREGLCQIEKQIGEKRVLVQNSSNVYRQMESTRREAKEIYFQRLGACIYQAHFDCQLDRIIMTLKADGATITEICIQLLELGMSRYRRTVRLIIRKYEDRWGIRSWKPEQLKYRWKKKPPIQ